MDFHVITLFPEMFESPFRGGMIGRAIEQGLIAIHPHALRPYGLGNYKQVDDAPYGGGSGMVMRPEPIAAAIDAVAAEHPQLWKVLMTPQGEVFDQALAREFSAKPGGLLLIAGRYEGIDERVRSMVNQEISIGDYVLSGGELAAMVVIEATGRLLARRARESRVTYRRIVRRTHARISAIHPARGVSRDARAGDSALGRSRQDSRMARSRSAPAHRAAPARPARAAQVLNVADLFLALIHHPVVNRNGQVVTSAITSLDIHDLARSSRTYGVRAFFVVHPIPEQREFAKSVIDHWRFDFGRAFDARRREALELVRIVATLDDACAEAEKLAGTRAIIIHTSARTHGGETFSATRMRLEAPDAPPAIIMLGTGFGMTPEMAERADILLEAIHGATDYNHLSVRAAGAIILDRLRSR